MPTTCAPWSTSWATTSNPALAVCAEVRANTWADEALLHSLFSKTEAKVGDCGRRVPAARPGGGHVRLASSHSARAAPRLVPLSSLSGHSAGSTRFAQALLACAIDIRPSRGGSSAESGQPSSTASMLSVPYRKYSRIREAQKASFHRGSGVHIHQQVRCLCILHGSKQVTQELCHRRDRGNLRFHLGWWLFAPMLNMWHAPVGLSGSRRFRAHGHIQRPLGRRSASRSADTPPSGPAAQKPPSHLNAAQLGKRNDARRLECGSGSLRQEG